MCSISNVSVFLSLNIIDRSEIYIVVLDLDIIKDKEWLVSGNPLLSANCNIPILSK